MEYNAELVREREYTARVQHLLYAIIEQSKDYAKFHDGTIRMMLTDAWEELRMKPTALSPQDLEQLSTDIDRYNARKEFSKDIAARYERMLLSPFFARVDFREDGEGELEKIVIGLYSLKDENGDIMVHDWRAPVCSLYYDAMPGEVSYNSPSGEIAGVMTLKRQYKMEKGKLVYYVDTDLSIDDEMLLDILSSATSRRMQSIVSTIQKEQNAAIRHDSARVVSVIGGAGSGKTSVAMHRAAYLMYRQREMLSASHIMVLSPSHAFSDYISTVLPDLGEENTRTLTLREMLSSILPNECEQPIRQIDKLITSGDDHALRNESVAYKSGAPFCDQLSMYAERFKAKGPNFQDILIGKSTLIKRTDLEKLYRSEFRLLSPALRLVRVQAVLDSRMETWEKMLYTQYENQLSDSYRGKDLDFATKLAVSNHLMPVRNQIKQMLTLDPLELYADAMEGAPEELYNAAFENAAARLIWWEDAPGIAWLMLKLGFAAPDKSIRHLIIDEAQDYPDIAMKMLYLRYPIAHVTLLGDPNQRSTPSMPECNPKVWGKDFGLPDAPVVELSRCYRSTLPITRLCSALLPSAAKSLPFGREGEWPIVDVYSVARLKGILSEWKDKYQSVAVITRSLAEARKLSKLMKNAFLLSGSEDEMIPETGYTLISSYALTKGLEFDAVAVVWPRAELTDSERRMLYTGCSRALHELCLLTDEDMIRDLGIVL